MADLRELYQEVIFDHYKRPRNCRPLDCANRCAEGFNPLCGDKVTVYLHLDGERIQDVTFEGLGCAISTASASLMTEALKGKTVEEAADIFEDFRTMITGPGGEHEHNLGKLAVLSGVREFPTRVKCATLAWHTLNAALKNKHEPVSTE